MLPQELHILPPMAESRKDRPRPLHRSCSLVLNALSFSWKLFGNIGSINPSSIPMLSALKKELYPLSISPAASPKYMYQASRIGLYTPLFPSATKRWYIIMLPSALIKLLLPHSTFAIRLSHLL